MRPRSKYLLSEYIILIRQRRVRTELLSSSLFAYLKLAPDIKGEYFASVSAIHYVDYMLASAFIYTYLVCLVKLHTALLNTYEEVVMPSAYLFLKNFTFLVLYIMYIVRCFFNIEHDTFFFNWKLIVDSGILCFFNLFL